jgi:hypothetical protein
MSKFNNICTISTFVNNNIVWPQWIQWYDYMRKYSPGCKIWTHRGATFYTCFLSCALFCAQHWTCYYFSSLLCISLRATGCRIFFFMKLWVTFFRMTHMLQRCYKWALVVQLNIFYKCTCRLPALHDQEMTPVVAAWLPASSSDITANIWAHVPTQRLYSHIFRNMISVPPCSPVVKLSH